MLRAVSKGWWFSTDYKLLADDTTIATFEQSWWGPSHLVVKGLTYELRHSGLFRFQFFLARDGAILARAERPSAFERSFEIEYRKRRFVLAAESGTQRYSLVPLLG